MRCPLVKRANTPTLLPPIAAVLAVALPFAFTFYQSPTLPQTPPPAGTATQRQPTVELNKESESKTRARDANHILSEFFGVDDYRQALWPDSDFRSRYSVQFMIATIPDPIHSSLPYLFDRFLASIQRAAATDDLVLDGFYLPWEPSEQKNLAIVPYAKEPGLLLFRNPPVPRALVVFLVSESPTAGVSKEALISALNQIAQLTKYRTKESESLPLKIPILGPTFSGSAESLDFVLHSWSPYSANGLRTARGEFHAFPS